MGDSKEHVATNEYLEKQTAAKQWIEEVTNQSIGDDLYEELRDGILLCRIISVLCPSLEISVITSTPHKYRIMENINAFLEACTSLGFSYTELFAPPDLFEQKNMGRVLDTLKKIADYASQFDFPKWKGSKAQFSRTERKSIIGGNSAKSVLPKGSVPFKRPVFSKSSPLHISSSSIQSKAPLSKAPLAQELSSNKQLPNLSEIKLPAPTNNTIATNSTIPTNNNIATTNTATNNNNNEDISANNNILTNTDTKPLQMTIVEENSTEEIIFFSKPKQSPDTSLSSSSSITSNSTISSSTIPSFNSSNVPRPVTSNTDNPLTHSSSLSSNSMNNPPTSTNLDSSSSIAFQKLPQNLFLPEDVQSIPPFGFSSNNFNIQNTKLGSKSTSALNSKNKQEINNNSTQSTKESKPAERKGSDNNNNNSSQPIIPAEQKDNDKIGRKDTKTQQQQRNAFRISRELYKDIEPRKETKPEPKTPLERKLEFSKGAFYNFPNENPAETKIVHSAKDLENALKQLSARYSEFRKGNEPEPLQRKPDQKPIAYQSSPSLLSHFSPPPSSPSLSSSSSSDSRPVPPPKPSSASSSRSSLSSSTDSPFKVSPLPNNNSNGVNNVQKSFLKKDHLDSGSNRRSLPPLPASPLSFSSSSSLSSSVTLSSTSHTFSSHSSSLSSSSPLPPLPPAPSVSSISSVSSFSSVSSTSSVSSFSSISNGDDSRRLKRTQRMSLLNIFSSPAPSPSSSSIPVSPPDTSPKLSSTNSPNLFSSSSSLTSSSLSSSVKSTNIVSHRRNHSYSVPPKPLDSTRTSFPSSTPSSPASSSPSLSSSPSHSLPYRGVSPKKGRKSLNSDSFTPPSVSSSSRPTPQPPSTPYSSHRLSPLSKTSMAVGVSTEGIDTLLQKLDEILQSSVDGSSILHLAARHNYPQVVAFLLQCGEDPNPQDSFGKTPLHVAAALGNREVVDILLSSGAHSLGATALQRAAEYNQASVMSKIVAVPGVNLNTLRHQDGWTPLYTSSHQGNHENVSLLLTYHADPNVQNADGWTPLHAAAHQGHYRVVKILATAGANLNVLSTQGTTPLFHAIERGELKIAKLLGELGANVDMSKNFGWKPLHMAVYKGSYDLTEWLVRSGARLNEIVRDTNLKSYTPLHILVSSDWLSESSKKNLEILLKSGSNILSRDDSGATPLHLAAYWDNGDAVKILMKYLKEDDIIFSMRDNNGETAADIAAYYGNLQVLKLLPKSNLQKVKNNPQTTGKMLPPQPPPLPPPQLPPLVTPRD